VNKSFALIVPFIFTLLFSQGKPYAGPEDPAGDPSAEREWYMTGNMVLLYFKNTQSFQMGGTMLQDGLIIMMV